MTSSRRASIWALGYGALALLVALGAALPTLHQARWNLTALVHVDARTPLGAVARRIEPGFHTVHPGAYDGQFYWAVAIDPLAAGALHRDVDKPSYRYGHPLFGWLGWAASAGEARAVPAALFAGGLVSIFAAAALAARLGMRRGGTGWQALFVALNPGLANAVANDLAEPLATALMLGAFAARAARRPIAAWVCLALMPLAKEPLALVLAALVAWELSAGRPRQATVTASALLPALAWWVYARLQLGAWLTSGGSALGRPFAGWWDALAGLGAGRGSVAWHDGARVILGLLLVLLLFGAVLAARRRGPVDLAYLALAAVALCLAPNATAEFSTALRNSAFLVVLLPFVLSLSPPGLPSPAPSTR